MSQHTPEPWKTESSHVADPTYPRADEEWEIFHHILLSDATTWIAEFVHKLDAQRIVACVNGCAGLNPAAYRACVEALKECLDEMQEAGEETWPHAQQAARTALAAVTEQP